MAIFFFEAVLLSFRWDEATSPHTRHISPASASEMATEALRGRGAAQPEDVLRDRSGCLKLSVAPAAPRGTLTCLSHLFMKTCASCGPLMRIGRVLFMRSRLRDRNKWNVPSVLDSSWTRKLVERLKKEAKSPIQVLLCDGEKGQLHVDSGLGASLHERNAIFLQHKPVSGTKGP